MNTPSEFVWRRLAIDCLVAAVLLSGSAIWATRYWNAWTAQGGRAFFYQTYFEPAVMVACGKGFVVSQGPHPKALDDFLARKRDTFLCADLPSDLRVGRQGLFQGAWIYLQLTVGWTWRLLGISWSRMGPLFGLLFGVVAALAYGIFRLGMGRVLAVLGVLGLATSYIHLINLPPLRDYAKAPFTLALVGILGLVVARPVRRRTLMLLAVGYGCVLGIGYGFRTDFLIDVPIFAIVVFAFLDGGVLKNLALKAAATLACLAAFAVVSWPVTSAVYQQGGCQWHVALLGLQAPFDEALHVGPAPYAFGAHYDDEYVSRNIQGFTDRTQPGAGSLVFCSHEYDVQSGRYLGAIVSAFPADMIVRAYASVLQIAELPFLSWASPLQGWATSLYDARREFLRPKIGWGVYIDAAALLIAASASLRLGFALLFFLCYFGGYPAIQFQERHHFHLEFITWWAAGFVAQQIVANAWALRRARPDWHRFSGGARRALIIGLSSSVLAAGVLAAARAYQQHTATSMFLSYIGAAKVPFELGGAGLAGVSPQEWPQFLEVDFDQSRCGPHPAVTFRNVSAAGDGDRSTTVAVSRRSYAPGLTRIFQPVEQTFQGLEFSDARPGCLAGAYRITDLKAFPLLFGVMLSPDWIERPLYQRLKDWERDPVPLPPLTALPAFSLWTAGAGRSATVSRSGVLDVRGDSTTAGYQLTSPRVSLPAGSHVFVHLALSVSQGQVCLGALDGAAGKWLTPAAVRQDMNVTIDESGGFMVALASCGATASSTPGRFRISSAGYAIE